MNVMKAFYEITYRYVRAPWDIGAREELVSLVERGCIKPCRAIDLGCGTGANAIYLAHDTSSVSLRTNRGVLGGAHLRTAREPTASDV